MREETQLEPICRICKVPITTRQRPSARLRSGERVHLLCFIDHPEFDEAEPRSDMQSLGERKVQSRL